MTNVHRITPVALALLLSFPAVAQVSASPSSGRRSQVVSAARKGSPFLSTTRQSYQVVGGVRAVVLGREDAGDAVSRMEVAGAEFLEVKGPYAIFRERAAPAGTEARIAEAGGVRSLPVAVNPITGELGVLNGMVVAMVRDPGDAQALASAHGLRLDHVAAPIRCVFLVVPDGRDVVAAAAALSRDPRVERASPEVIEHVRVPN